QIGRGVGAELAQDACAMRLDRARADRELVTYVARGEPRDRQIEDLALPDGQRGELAELRLRPEQPAVLVDLFGLQRAAQILLARGDRPDGIQQIFRRLVLGD